MRAVHKLVDFIGLAGLVEQTSTLGRITGFKMSWIFLVKSLFLLKLMLVSQKVPHQAPGAE